MVPDFICRVVGPVPVAPLSSATVTGVLALQVTDTVAVAFTAFVSTDAVGNAMLVAVVVHWAATLAVIDRVPVALCGAAAAKAEQVAGADASV